MIGGVTWSDGQSRDLDEPQAGSITFTLSNANGEWLPNSPLACIRTRRFCFGGSGGS